jgi:ribosomal protein S18 acetylase RimI-like enzyme
MDDRIVLASEDDRKEILELYKAQLGRKYCAWNEEYPGDETITFDLSRDALFVMKRKDKIIGAVSLEEDEDVDNLECWDPDLAPGGELARLCVLPELQNDGIGRQLMGFGMKELKNRGYKSTHFLVNKDNVKAIRAYASFDFSVVGECFMYEQNFLCYEKAL